MDEKGDEEKLTLERSEKGEGQKVVVRGSNVGSSTKKKKDDINFYTRKRNI